MLAAGAQLRKITAREEANEHLDLEVPSEREVTGTAQDNLDAQVPSPRYVAQPHDTFTNYADQFWWLPSQHSTASFKRNLEAIAREHEGVCSQNFQLRKDLKNLVSKLNEASSAGAESSRRPSFLAFSRRSDKTSVSSAITSVERDLIEFQRKTHPNASATSSTNTNGFRAICRKVSIDDPEPSYNGGSNGNDVFVVDHSGYTQQNSNASKAPDTYSLGPCRSESGKSAVRAVGEYALWPLGTLPSSQHSGMGRMSSTATAKSSASASHVKRIFPSWYDPEDARRFQPLTSVGTLPPIEERAVMKGMARSMEELEGAAHQAKCMMSPVSPVRLVWDFIAIVCLLYEIWSIAIDLVFITGIGRPYAMDLLDWLLLCFFSVDIVLNFFTGYLKADRIVWKRRLVALQYLRRWFVIDVIATVPWDKTLDSLADAGRVHSVVRVAKIRKVFKTIKFLRLARILKSVSDGADFSGISAIFSVFANPLNVIIVLFLTAHVNGSVWAICQPHWSGSDDLQQALRMYYQSLWWAFMALTVGSVGGTSSDSDRPTLWSLDIVIAIERLCIIAWVYFWGTLRFTVRFKNEAVRSKAAADAIKYLRGRGVSVYTQIQVMFSIRETSKAVNSRRRFEALVGGLPSELQRKICEEMWSRPLMSLGLIMHATNWHEDLISELALVAEEEVFPSRSIVFRERNAASTAYYITAGVVTVITSRDDRVIPDLTTDMWLGEKALVNPLLRRSGTAVCRSLTTMMSIGGERFQKVLAKLGVTDEFEQLCNELLWRGLCGRCGLLGDHFSHECPLTDPSNKGDLAGPSRTSKSSFRLNQMRSNSRMHTWHKVSTMDMVASMTGGTFVLSNPVQLDPKLKHFLQIQNLDWLESHLKNLGVLDLDGLKAMNVADLRRELETNDGEVAVLSEHSERALSPVAIDKFSKAVLTQTGNVLALNVDRSQHYIFLSHFKMEAGTEAALIRHEFEQLIANDSGSPAHHLACPVFLDTEDLTCLSQVQDKIRQSHNVALLLSKDVLTRPWVLIEVATAFETGAHLVPILLMRGFAQFSFPDEEFYETLRNGTLLGETGGKMLKECGIEEVEVERALRFTFQRIAMPYSPHRPEIIRQSELQSVLKQCRLKRAF